MIFPLQLAETSNRFEMGCEPCFVSHCESKSLLPIGDALTPAEHGLVELVVLQPEHPNTNRRLLEEMQPDSNLQLQEWIEEAYRQYRSVIAPEGFIDRCDDWLVESLSLTPSKALRIYEERGITPFVRLERAVFVPSEGITCLDLKCFADVYLWDHGFNVDKTREAIWEVSPRERLRGTESYPAFSLHKHQKPEERVPVNGPTSSSIKASGRRGRPRRRESD